MYQIARRVSTASFLFALVAIPSYPQLRPSFGSVESGSVHGTVQNAGIGNRLSVVLDAAAGSGGYQTDIGQQGQFYFAGVAEGTYVVKVVDLYGNTLAREFVNVNGVSAPVTLRLPDREQEAVRPTTISLRRLAHKIPKGALKEFERANKAARKNRTDEALLHLRRAIELDPEFFDAYVNLGARLIRSGNPAEAVVLFEKAMRLDEHNSILYSNTATALLMLKRAAEAERAARRAVDLDPLNARARYMVGVSLLEQKKQIAEAVETLQGICDTFPYARVALAQTFALQGKRDEAVLELKAYLDTGRLENREQVQTWLTGLNQMK